MDITAKRYGLFQLWLESFRVVNKCTGKLIKIFLCLLLVVLLIVGVLILCAGTTFLLNQHQPGNMSPTVGLWAGLLNMAISLVSNLLGLFFMTVVYRVIAAHIYQRQQPLIEAFSSSVLPTLYQILANFLISIPILVFGIVLAIVSRGNPWVFILATFLVALIGIRFCYSFIAIAVDSKGPIEGLVCSWNLTKDKQYTDALLMCLMLVGSMVVLMAVTTGIGVLAFSLFAKGTSLPVSFLILGILGVVLFIIGTYCYVSILSFPLLVFLNRKSQEQFSQVKETAETIFIPLPELDTPSNTQPGENTQRLNDASLNITKTSVNTSDEESTDLSQHLEQVYTPQDKQVIHHQEEDRMPTILFDDELAKQLEHQFLEEQKQSSSNNSDETDPGNDSIPLSK